MIVFFDADTLCHAVTLTFDPLTLKVPGTSSVTWSKLWKVKLGENYERGERNTQPTVQCHKVKH